jgi:hypothetical protein
MGFWGQRFSANREGYMHEHTWGCILIDVRFWHWVTLRTLCGLIKEQAFSSREIQ